MKKGILKALCIVLCTACIKSGPDSELVAPGDHYPLFNVILQDGTPFSSSDFTGSPGVLIFFNSSCKDCRVTLPFVQQAYETYASRGVRFVAVSRAETEDSVASYWEESGFTFPYSAQEDRAVYDLFASSRIPRIYISDRNGVVTAVFTDDPNPRFEQISSEIEKVL